MSLPINDVLPPLLDALMRSACVLLQAPPGAGKSTWLPLQLLTQPWLSGRIIMLEPRRLAARNVAHRLAEQLNQSPGELVGYRMRSESVVGSSTRLEIVTEGVLIRLLQRDPMLEGVSLVILDEFHERSLQADLALSLLLDVQSGLRDDLKLLIMSATLDNQTLRQCLPDAPVISASGRSFPVERNYVSLPTAGQFEDNVASVVRQILQQHCGSLLLFLPGVGEIKRVCARLTESVTAEVDLCPLYGALSLAEQRKAIAPAPTGRRKVVLATNIAETSLTIDGISLVVDCGLERVARFDARSGLTRLVTQRVSKAAMIQRAGRAGRLMPGVCWHLLAKEQADRAAEQRVPEILQADLSSLVLELLMWGARDEAQLRWLDCPPAQAIQAARTLLRQLGALDSHGNLTAIGRSMAETGCEPRLAAMIVAAQSQGPASLSTALLLAAILEEPPRNGVSDITYWLTHPQPSWLTRVNQLAQRLNQPFGALDPDEIPFLLAVGFADRIAQQRDRRGRFLLANGVGAYLDETSALCRHDWLIAASLLQNANGPDARILMAASVDLEQLVARFPQLVTEHSAIAWHDEKGTLRAELRQQIGRLVVKRSPLPTPSESQWQAALLDWVRAQGLAALHWDAAADQLRARIACAAQWLTLETWPDVSDAALLADLEQWLSPSLHGIRSIKALRQCDLLQALSRRLDWQQRQRLDRALPTHYVTPTGTQVMIRYSTERPPTVSVRLQEMFGEKNTPMLADGTVALTLELLSPAQRPLQITQDLTAFWQGAYKAVQKEMKGRYPKHVWPDDPATALPTRKTKRYYPQEGR